MSIGAPKNVTPLMVSTLIRTKIPAPYQQRAAELYPAGTTNEEALQSYVQILTDGQFTSTVRRTAKAVSEQQDEPVFRYFFSHTQSQLLLKKFGAYHGLELFYVFNNYENSPYSSGSAFTAADDSVQQYMLKYWVNFAKNGNPNDSKMAVWPEFESSADCYMEIKNTLNGTQCGLRTAKCDLWDSVYAYMSGTTETETVSIDNSEKLIVGAFPNPFNPKVMIFINSTMTFSELSIYDLKGRLVKKLTADKTSGSVSWDGTQNSSGTYILKATSGIRQQMLKLLLLK
ncbi:MAG: carboxylesterase family protein [Fibrobacteres bacterium]|nr:carboxylesterase family protein [Fibrobacterota bacterium]